MHKFAGSSHGTCKMYFQQCLNSTFNKSSIFKKIVQKKLHCQSVINKFYLGLIWKISVFTYFINKVWDLSLVDFDRFKWYILHCKWLCLITWKMHEAEYASFIIQVTGHTNRESISRTIAKLVTNLSTFYKHVQNKSTNQPNLIINTFIIHYVIQVGHG